MRLVKYRGTQKGANEYPFPIDKDGTSVLRITSLGLQHKASKERVSSGIPDLDEMLEGKATIIFSAAAGCADDSLSQDLAQLCDPHPRQRPLASSIVRNL